MYLVTGGFGAFGMATARWLVGEGARHLTLVGRTGAAEAVRRELVEFTEAGIEIIEECVDVANGDAVDNLVSRIHSTSCPLKGIFHAAGVVINHSIHEVTLESLLATFAPKVDGVLNLHSAALLSGARLDLFVIYSSISGLAGTGRQVGYAAANATLDTIATHLRMQGIPATVIDWGGMAGGMAEPEAAGGRLLELFGYQLIDMDQGLRLMKRVIELDIPQAVIAEVNWAQWAAVHAPSTRTPRFAEIVASPDTNPPGSAIKAEILALPTDQRAPVITMLLAEELSAVLRLPTEELDLYAPVTDLGLDSLTAMELGARASKALGGMQLSVLEFSGGHSLNSIGAKLANRLARESGSDAVANQESEQANVQ